MGIELKNKQKEVLLSILEKFYSENGDFSSLCEESAGEIGDTEDYAFHYGASKGVIVPLKQEDRSIFPYVIKIPFLYEDEEYKTKIVNHCRIEQKILSLRLHLTYLIFLFLLITLVALLQQKYIFSNR